MWIEKYGHGGDLLTAAENFNIEKEKMLDFSANINPLGIPDPVLQLIKESLKEIVHYPDPSQRQLREKLAKAFQLSSDHFLIGNGAAECMAISIQAIKPRKIGLIYPCFSEYEILASAYDIPVMACVAYEENQYKPNENELYSLFQETDLIFIGHPNNPTGTLYSMDELLKMAEWAKSCDTYLIIDEAFIDFVPKDGQVSLLPEIKKFPNVILIHSMTKMYAIPGLRLGYMIAAPEIILKAQRKQVTWSVNQLALLAGEACLQERGFVNKTQQLVSQEREYLFQKLKEELQLSVFPSQVNFLLAKLPEERSVSDFQFELGKKGVLIRSCATYPGLTNQHFRIAIRTRDENDRLCIAMKQVLKEGLV